MTYLERFGNVSEYAKYEANKYLEMIKKDGYKYYYETYYKHIDLLTYPEIYMTDEIKEKKRKALAHIEFLKNVVEGKAMSEIYVMAWEGLKNSKWPEYRK